MYYMLALITFMYVHLFLKFYPRFSLNDWTKVFLIRPIFFIMIIAVLLLFVPQMSFVLIVIFTAIWIIFLLKIFILLKYHFLVMIFKFLQNFLLQLIVVFLFLMILKVNYSVWVQVSQYFNNFFKFNQIYWHFYYFYHFHFLFLQSLLVR